VTWWWAGPEWRHKMTNKLVYSGIHIISTIFRVFSMRWTLETCIGNDLGWNNKILLETYEWKQKSSKTVRLKTVGNKSMVSKQSFEIGNIICRFMFPIANFCFEITQYVSNLILLFRNSFTIDIACWQPMKCFQSMFPIYKLPTWS